LFLGGILPMFSTMSEIKHFFRQRETQLGMDFGLSRMEMLLDLIGNPHHHLTCIHIAGSNGKGSTLHYMKEMLRTEGYNVAAFTSPYLENINEQLTINDKMICDEDFITFFQKVYEKVSKLDADHIMPTQFEIITAMAFLYFEQKEVDVVLVETGLGGRLDATNVITPVLSVITSISLEHTNILGNTLAEIAAEKAGIIKQGVPVISGVREKEPLVEIEKKAQNESADLFVVDRDIVVSDIQHQADTQSFSFSCGNLALKNVELSMLGHHQIDNAALAVTAIYLLQEQGLSVREESIRHGLKKARWKGRFEALSDRILLDAAHNPAGIEGLLQTLQTHYKGKKYCFVFTALKDKNYKKMISMVDEVASELYITEIPHQRGAMAEELYNSSQHQKKHLVKDWQHALKQAMEEKEAIIIVTGSLYFLALARPYLQKH
jgi:dihydrofolate synthase/folylpolyglutamate synthase